MLLVRSYEHVFRKPNEAEPGGNPLRGGSGRDTIAGPNFLYLVLADEPFQPTVTLAYSRTPSLSNLELEIIWGIHYSMKKRKEKHNP